VSSQIVRGQRGRVGTESGADRGEGQIGGSIGPGEADSIVRGEVEVCKEVGRPGCSVRTTWVAADLPRGFEVWIAMKTKKK
jgi:hypothetical protein